MFVASSHGKFCIKKLANSLSDFHFDNKSQLFNRLKYSRFVHRCINNSIIFILKNKILHPVVDREFFKKALVKRMVGRTGVLAQSRRELNTMTSVELDEIADIARAQLREHLRAFEARN